MVWSSLAQLGLTPSISSSSPTSDGYLGNPLDLGATGDYGMAVAILLKLNVAQVQDTGNDSKEVLWKKKQGSWMNQG